MYKKYRYNSTDIHVYEGKATDLRLLQHEKLNPLSYLRYGNDKPKAVINCSYFSSKFVLGRNQGDLKNDTHDQDGFYDLVFLNDGTYRIGSFKSWDYSDKSKVNAGFSVATILILDSMSVNQYSNAICQASKLSLRNPQTAVGVLANGNVLLIVADGRTAQNVGLTGYELRTFIKNNYPTIELLCQLDGGGSTEMIVNGKIVNIPSDGKERNMFNGLAFISSDKTSDKVDDTLDDNSTEVEPLMCPFRRMHVTQYDNGNYSHQGSDAWDITSGTAGIKDPYFAPCDLVCKAIDLTYAFTWWQSVNKVKFADGTVDYVTMMFGHDENINATVGMTIKKGTQVGNMGAGGTATGTHCHIEVAKGQYKGKWYKNDKGVYCLYNSIKFYDAFYMDNVQLINVECDKFKYLETENLKDVVNELKSQITELQSEISVLKKNNADLETLINTQADALSVKENAINNLKSKLLEIKNLCEV